MPTGASSNIPIGGSPAFVIRPLITRFVDVLINVTELVRIDANATGISRDDGDTLDFAVIPSTIGRKKAAAAVLLMNALNTATLIITTASRGAGRVPACRRIARPTK